MSIHGELHEWKWSVCVRTAPQWFKFIKQNKAYVQLYESEVKTPYAYSCITLNRIDRKEAEEKTTKSSVAVWEGHQGLCCLSTYNFFEGHKAKLRRHGVKLLPCIRLYPYRLYHRTPRPQQTYCIMEYIMQIVRIWFTLLMPWLTDWFLVYELCFLFSARVCSLAVHLFPHSNI